VSALSTLLDGYIAEDELAAEPNAPCKRTLARYRAEPDGLPYMRFRGRVYIPIKEGREWLRRRVRYPNPTRKAKNGEARSIRRTSDHQKPPSTTSDSSESAR
jgi:hypothetical protein